MQIPRGVVSSTTLRVRSEGNTGRHGGARGDLLLRVCSPSEDETHTFRRDGADLHCDTHISYTQSILGTTVCVPTVDGESVAVRVPPGVQPAQKLRLRGRGGFVAHSPTRGDALLTIVVSLPQRLSERERELVEELAALERGETIEQKSG